MAATIKRKATTTNKTKIHKQTTLRGRLESLDASIQLPPEMQPQLDRIAACATRTAFEKRVLTLLCQVPRGRVTTYGLMARHLDSAPRAVGNALRRNPFAPQVPCHRVVATGGTLGGFKGQWLRKPGADECGTTLEEKRRLLKSEGVRFDERGRVLGTPFEGFA